MTVTPSDIKGITGSTIDDALIQPFIAASACLIDNCGANLTTECKDQAQTYLAAHLLTTSNVGKDSALVKREMLLNEYEVEYIVSKGGVGILSTPFGETANMLTNGCLANMDKIQPSFHGLGCI